MNTKMQKLLSTFFASSICSLFITLLTFIFNLRYQNQLSTEFVIQYLAVSLIGMTIAIFIPLAIYNFFIAPRLKFLKGLQE